MNPGETERYMCDSCLLEFEVTLEPHPAGGGEPGDVEYCPFCGSEAVALL